MCREPERIELSSEAGEKVSCLVADSFWSRLVGLMGKPKPPNGEGLLIRPCSSIHMFFMRFSIDAVFLDNDYRIVRVVRNLAPGRIVGTVPGARQVLEVATGELPASFSEGSKLLARSI